MSLRIYNCISGKKNIDIKKLRNEIIELNRISRLEKYNNKIYNIKFRFNDHIHIIDKLDGYNDTIIDDLNRISYYDSLRYIHPNVKIYICNIVDKYLLEFSNDKDVLEFFVYILILYNCSNINNCYETNDTNDTNETNDTNDTDDTN